MGDNPGNYIYVDVNADFATVIQNHHPEPQHNKLRLENSMTTLKNEIELRDMKMQHQAEMN